jgi:hypothetical protein
MNCPNYPSCQLIHKPGFVKSKTLLDAYIRTYCLDSLENWSACKRFMTNNMLHFCPDFVFPDTALSVDEIIDKFDQDSFQPNNMNQ